MTATNFPTSLDATGSTLPTVATTTDNLNASGNKRHDTKHNIEGGAIIALETKVGIGSSTPTAGLSLVGTGDGSSTWQAIPLPFASNGDIAGGNTRYLGPGSSMSATEAVVLNALPGARIFTAMYVKAQTAPVGSETVIYTLRKNGVATAITVTLTGNNTTGSITGQSVSFAAGDQISLSVVASASAVTGAHNAMLI